MERSGMEALRVLAEPLRRDLYLYVAGRGEPVGRDEAAQAVGIKRSLAAFHLDRLADEGLLEVTYGRLSGRSGPGAGRPAKLYCRAPRQFELSLPPRQYELASRLLVQAMSFPGDPRERLGDEAHAFGAAAGDDARERGADPKAAALDGLRSLGYEPYEDAEGTIRLRNCPFHALVDDHRDLVCGMNLELIRGLVAGAALQTHEARPAPQDGMCCVVLQARKLST